MRIGAPTNMCLDSNLFIYLFIRLLIHSFIFFFFIHYYLAFLTFSFVETSRLLHQSKSPLQTQSCSLTLIVGVCGVFQALLSSVVGCQLRSLGWHRAGNEAETGISQVGSGCVCDIKCGGGEMGKDIRDGGFGRGEDIRSLGWERRMNIRDGG